MNRAFTILISILSCFNFSLISKAFSIKSPYVISVASFPSSNNSHVPNFIFFGVASLYSTFDLEYLIATGLFSSKAVYNKSFDSLEL